MSADEEKGSGYSGGDPLPAGRPLQTSTEREPAIQQERSKHTPDRDGDERRHLRHRITEGEERPAPEEIDRAEGRDQRQPRGTLSHETGLVSKTTS
jgi:hypothetical protein